jgi:hypothetical protein
MEYEFYMLFGRGYIENTKEYPTRFRFILLNDKKEAVRKSKNYRDANELMEDINRWENSNVTDKFIKKLWGHF